ncbi:MAG: type VI secretion system contractile sheath small subunit [Fibromonadaceae bacterium]|jgi:type VI secretion system protein ImpB|nr:type VI secretion system contractile sheath small subunit [Fibromonadaceae bacterium]
MANSYQNEIPPARINIQLSVDNGGAQKKMELPLKLLVLGDFKMDGDESRLIEREKININKDNFDGVMQSLNVELKTSVENRLKKDNTNLPIKLKFDSMKSFEPMEIVKQVPDLNRLMAVRNLIKDLGSNLLDNREFRKKMEIILKDKNSMNSVLTELKALPTETANKE